MKGVITCTIITVPKPEMIRDVNENLTYGVNTKQANGHHVVPGAEFYVQQQKNHAWVVEGQRYSKKEGKVRVDIEEIIERG